MNNEKSHLVLVSQELLPYLNYRLKKFYLDNDGRVFTIVTFIGGTPTEEETSYRVRYLTNKANEATSFVTPNESVTAVHPFIKLVKRLEIDPAIPEIPKEVHFDLH